MTSLKSYDIASDITHNNDLSTDNNHTKISFFDKSFSIINDNGKLWLTFIYRLIHLGTNCMVNKIIAGKLRRSWTNIEY